MGVFFLPPVRQLHIRLWHIILTFSSVAEGIWDTLHNWSWSAQTVFIFNLTFNQNVSNQKRKIRETGQTTLENIIKRGVKQRQKDVLFEGTAASGQKIISRAEDTNTLTSSLFLMVISICVTKESYKTVQGDKLVMQLSFYLPTPQSRN